MVTAVKQPRGFRTRQHTQNSNFEKDFSALGGWRLSGAKVLARQSFCVLACVVAGIQELRF